MNSYRLAIGPYNHHNQCCEVFVRFLSTGSTYLYVDILNPHTSIMLCIYYMYTHPQVIAFCKDYMEKWPLIAGLSHAVFTRD